MSGRRFGRRWFLGALATTISVGVAGCTRSPRTSPNETQTDTTTDTTGLVVGKQPPDFSLAAVGGETVSLRPVERPTILTTIATWCPSCEEESHRLTQIHSQYSGQIRLITIDMDSTQDSMADLRAFKQDHGGEWPHVMATPDVIRDYRIRSLDTTYLLDRRGIIQYKDTSSTSVATLERELDPLLASGERA